MFPLRLFEYVRTLPPEHNDAIARVDFPMLTPISRIGSGRVGSGRIGSRIGSGLVGSGRIITQVNVDV
jgi:hypothetical protein